MSRVNTLRQAGGVEHINKQQVFLQCVDSLSPSKLAPYSFSGGPSIVAVSMLLACITTLQAKYSLMRRLAALKSKSLVIASRNQSNWSNLVQLSIKHDRWNTCARFNCDDWVRLIDVRGGLGKAVSPVNSYKRTFDFLTCNTLIPVAAYDSKARNP